MALSHTTPHLLYSEKAVNVELLAHAALPPIVPGKGLRHQYSKHLLRRCFRNDLWHDDSSRSRTRRILLTILLRLTLQCAESLILFNRGTGCLRLSSGSSPTWLSSAFDVDHNNSTSCVNFPFATKAYIRNPWMILLAFNHFDACSCP